MRTLAKGAPAEGSPAAPALAPGSTIGILGGGQLGRMLALAAARLGFKCHVFSPDPESPAFDVAAARTVADYGNAAALADFAGAVEVVTYEFENVAVAAVEGLAKTVPVRPGARSLALSQDRLVEKTFLSDLGCAVAPFAAVDDLASLKAALADLGVPSVLKTRRFGYDGKGQVVIRSPEEAGAALAAIKNAPAILEGFVDFAREISVIGARGLDGATAVYDPSENVHEGGILRTATVPARVDAGTAADASQIAEKIMAALDHVGVIGIELFVVETGEGARLVVNEFAPRVHNSGHWTDDACAVSQFENHIRAIAGWRLGPTTRHADAVMTNLIGEEAAGWPRFAAEPGARLHLYGKREARKGRKMGHVTRLSKRR